MSRYLCRRISYSMGHKTLQIPSELFKTNRARLCKRLREEYGMRAGTVILLRGGDRFMRHDTDVEVSRFRQVLSMQIWPFSRWPLVDLVTIKKKCIFIPRPSGPRGIIVVSVRPPVCLSVPLYDQSSPRDNSRNIFQIFFKLGRNILWLNISDKFDHEYRSSLNMSVIDQKVILTFLKVMKSFCNNNLEIWDR